MHFGQTNIHQHLDESRTLPIKKVQEEKDLEVLISEDLKPSKMITRQAGRAHGKLTQMLKSFTFREKNLLNLYQEIIRPSLIYGITTWRSTNLREQETQKRVLRACSHLKGGFYEERCKEAKILTIKKTMEEEDMLQVWRMMSEKDVVDRRRFWQLESEVQGRGRPPEPG